jgi:bifunctional N-acetylglucosamine-1-phosphate-uridyltransferase/glucosamine-1-phosphate-acetyltransferase GlmU-like protein
VSLTLVILAAGTGSRYGGMKVMEPLGPNGESIVNYSVYDARRAGFDRFLFVIRPEIERPFREWADRNLGRQSAIDFAFQKLADLPRGFHVPPGRTKPWGTTHALLSVAHSVREPFAVINIGDFYGADSYRVIAAHLRTQTDDFALATFVLRNTLPEVGPVARAICRVDENGLLSQIVEMKNIDREKGKIKNVGIDGQEYALSGNELVSMNMWGFTPTLFPLLAEELERFLSASGSEMTSESCLPDAIGELLKAGKIRVRALKSSDSCFGLTYTEDYTRAATKLRHLIEAGCYPKRLVS